MKRSIFFWSLGGTQSSVLNRPASVLPRGTWPAIFAARSGGAEVWIRRTADPGFASQQPTPFSVGADAERRDQPDTSDDDSSHARYIIRQRQIATRPR